jgi:hypothetical protein
MIDVHELLRNKEDQIVRVRQEIDALHVVAQILENDEAQGSQSPEDAHARIPVVENNFGESLSGDDGSDQPLAESADSLSKPIPPKRGLLRDWFGRAAGE